MKWVCWFFGCDMYRIANRFRTLGLRDLHPMHKNSNKFPVRRKMFVNASLTVFPGSSVEAMYPCRVFVAFWLNVSRKLALKPETLSTASYRSMVWIIWANLYYTCRGYLHTRLKLTGLPVSLSPYIDIDVNFWHSGRGWQSRTFVDHVAQLLCLLSVVKTLHRVFSSLWKKYPQTCFFRPLVVHRLSMNKYPPEEDVLLGWVFQSWGRWNFYFNAILH